MALSWCKVSSDLDMHPKVRRAGRNGREVFLFALRRNAGSNAVPGLLPGVDFEPWYLADVLMITEAEAIEGLAKCVIAGLLSHEGKAIRIVGWDDDWGKQTKTNAERQAAFRAKHLNTPVSNARNADSVTSNAHSNAESVDQIRGDKNRVEEKRETPRKRGTPLDPAWLPSVTVPNGKAAAKARARGVNLDDELDKLKNWAASKGEVGKDWDARWRLWLSNARPSNNGAQPRTLTNADVLPGLLAKIRDGEEQDRKLEGADS